MLGSLGLRAAGGFGGTRRLLGVGRAAVWHQGLGMLGSSRVAGGDAEIVRAGGMLGEECQPHQCGRVRGVIGIRGADVLGDAAGQ